jgi:hypothetical protein
VIFMTPSRPPVIERCAAAWTSGSDVCNTGVIPGWSGSGANERLESGTPILTQCSVPAYLTQAFHLHESR